MATSLECHVPGFPGISVRGVAQPGSALGLGPRGRRFESSRPDQKPQLHQQLKEAWSNDFGCPCANLCPEMPAPEVWRTVAHGTECSSLQRMFLSLRVTFG